MLRSPQASGRIAQGLLVTEGVKLPVQSHNLIRAGIKRIRDSLLLGDVGNIELEGRDVFEVEPDAHASVSGVFDVVVPQGSLP